jgi:hypothetical protein
MATALENNKQTKRRKHFMSRQFGAGRFGNGPNVYNESQSEFDLDTRRRLDGLGPSSPQLTAEQVKQAYEEALRADETRTTKSQSADEFLALHPEFLDVPKNANLMNDTLKAMFGDCAYTTEHFQAAYNVLCVSDSLDIDKAEVAKQQQAAANVQRKTAIKKVTDAAARAFNPNVDYENESLEELRARANEELQKAGERGGNGW